MSRFIIYLTFLAGFLPFTPGNAAYAADEDSTPAKIEPSTAGNSLPLAIDEIEAVEVEKLESPLSETRVETHRSTGVAAGYRFIGVDGFGGRAAEFVDLHSGPEFSYMNSVIGRDHKFILDGIFVSDNDFNANLTYDYMGSYRLKFSTDSFYHNLDNYSLFTPDFNFGSSYAPKAMDAGENYGIRVEQDLASLRARIGTYPIHLNLQYWRMLKKGDSQLRYADTAFFPGNAKNSIYSVRRPVDLQTHEGRIGFDAHIGHIDLIYDLTIRQQDNGAGAPVDSFVDRTSPGSYQRTAGNYEHNEIPESRYISHTVKLHTEQTGGIVAAAAYTIAQRENRSSLSHVSGADGLKETLQTAAGDLVYTHGKEISMALRFRHQEINRDSATITALNFTTPSSGNEINANQGIDTKKDIITAVFSYKPLNTMTVKGEYKGEFTDRRNTGSWDPYQNSSGISIPSGSDLHRGTVSVLSKPVKNLRLKAKYSFTTVNDPEYGVSFDNRHEGQLLAVYTLKDRIGFSGNYLISRDENESSSIRRLYLGDSAATPPIPPNYDSVKTGRERVNNSATGSVWGNLLEGRLSLTGTAGILHSKADQQALFSATSDQQTSAATNYKSQALLYGITASFKPVDKLETSVAVQQIRSYSEFDPDYFGDTANNTSGIKELSWLKTIENSFSLNAAYQLHKNVSFGVDYRYRKYDDQRSSMFDGSVSTVMTTLSAKW